MEWLNEETKEYAYKKVSVIINIIGYQEFYLDTKAIYEMYKDIEIKDDEFFANMVRINKNSKILKYKEVVKTGKEDELEMSVPP